MTPHVHAHFHTTLITKLIFTYWTGTDYAILIIILIFSFLRSVLLCIIENLIWNGRDFWIVKQIKNYKIESNEKLIFVLQVFAVRTSSEERIQLVNRSMTVWDDLQGGHMISDGNRTMRRKDSWSNTCGFTAVTKLYADTSMLGNCTSRATEPTSESVLQMERWACISWRPWESWLECASDNHQFVTILTETSHLKYWSCNPAKRHPTAGTSDGLVWTMPWTLGFHENGEFD